MPSPSPSRQYLSPRSSLWPLLTLLLLGCLLCSLGWNSWPVADDYCNISVIHKAGSALNFGIQVFQKWSGRSATTWLLGLVVETLGMKYFNAGSAALGIGLVLASGIFASILAAGRRGLTLRLTPL